MDSVFLHSFTVNNQVKPSNTTVQECHIPHIFNRFVSCCNVVHQGITCIEGKKVDWQQKKETSEDSRRRYAAHNIPDTVTGMIWKATRKNTNKNCDKVAVCPSMPEYSLAVAHIPKDSAAGTSGLSYNILRFFILDFG